MITNAGVKQILLFPKWWKGERAESFVLFWRPPRVSLAASAQGNGQTLAIPMHKECKKKSLYPDGLQGGNSIPYYYYSVSYSSSLKHLTSTNCPMCVTIYIYIYRDRNIFSIQSFDHCRCHYWKWKYDLCLQRILTQILGQCLI